jgi:hypothetical protein
MGGRERDSRTSLKAVSTAVMGLLVKDGLRLVWSMVERELWQLDQWKRRDQTSLGGSAGALNGSQVKYPIPGPPI